MEANGFARGIWVLWRDFFYVEVALNHNQFIHLKNSIQNVIQAWVTAVYASPNSISRRELWHQLNCIARSMHDPWLVGVTLIQFYMLRKNMEGLNWARVFV